MMEDTEILHDGLPIGQYISGPDDEMIIHYMPYRSLSHYQFGQALQSKGSAKIAVGEKTFTVLEVVEPHCLRLSNEDLP
jgi:hypothetical protein